MEFLMLKNPSWFIFTRWPHALQNTGPTMAATLGMSHRTLNPCTHSLLFGFLTQWRSSWHWNPLNCPFRCEILIAAPRALFPLTQPFIQVKEETQCIFLTCPERGLERRWACRGGQWNATSAPPLAPPSSSSPRAALGRTGWAPRSLGKARSCETHPPSSSAPCSSRNRRASFQKLWKHKQ